MGTVPNPVLAVRQLGQAFACPSTVSMDKIVDGGFTRQGDMGLYLWEKHQRPQCAEPGRHRRYLLAYAVISVVDRNEGVMAWLEI